MNNNWVQLGAVAVAVAAFYFFMSPYRECMREKNAQINLDNILSEQHQKIRSVLSQECKRTTSW
jgi:hypothetical protein